MDQHYQIAGEHIKSQDYNAALTELKLSLKNQPENPDCWSTYGVCLFHLKQLPEAIDALNKSQTLDPDNPYRYSSRAYIHSIMGNTDLAIADYKKCIALDPEDIIALNNLGLVYEKQGHGKKAKTYFHEADVKAGIDHITEKNGTAPVPETARPDLDPEKQSAKDEEKSLFSPLSSKAGRKAFFSFIKNGFKLK